MKTSIFSGLQALFPAAACLVGLIFAGCANRVLLLDNKDSYVEIPNIEYYQISEPGFTLECRLKVIELPTGAAPIISNLGFYPGGGYQIQINRQGFVQFEFRGTNRVRALVESGRPLIPGQWYHLAFVYVEDGRGSLLQMFIDGDLEAEELIEGDRIHYRGVSPILYLGTNIDRETSDRNFTGMMEEVRIWKKPLTRAALNQPPQELMAGNAEWLAAYWDFRSGPGDIGIDRSETGNPGVLQGRARKVRAAIPD